MPFTVSLLDATFVALLGVLALTRLIWPTRYQLPLVLAGSAALVSLGSPRTMVVITGLTLGFIFPLHLLIKRAVDRRWPRVIASSLLPGGLILLVSLLLFFKTYNEFAVPWLGTQWISQEALAVVGFSYFIFRAISALRINAILNTAEPTPWVMLSYMLFPPTLTSGPIQKYHDFRAQALKPAPLTLPLFYSAVYRITRGYFRKVFVGTVLAGVTPWLLEMPSPTVWVSVAIIVSLYLYFYYDFAGYSDIAIGFGLLLGIKVPENFKQPFLATTVSEFWRNWHITLVDFMREHVYIPLGGMRGSRRRAAILSFLIMVLAGLWHGVAVSFLLWGMWYGAWLAYEALAGTGPIPPTQRRGFRYWCRLLQINAIAAAPSVLFLPDTATMFRVLRGLTNFGFW